MRAALLNLSPKAIIEKSQVCMSARILSDVKRSLRHRQIYEIDEYHVKTGMITSELVDEMLLADVWIWSIPIYAGGLPSHVLSLLLALEEICREKVCDRVQLYAIMHGGLYEGMQGYPALKMIRSFCLKTGINYGGGLSIGGCFDKADQLMTRFGFGRGRSYARQMSAFGDVIAAGRSSLNSNCSPDISKKGYLRRMNRHLAALSRDTSNV